MLETHFVESHWYMSFLFQQSREDFFFKNQSFKDVDREGEAGVTGVLKNDSKSRFKD